MSRRLMPLYAGCVGFACFGVMSTARAELLYEFTYHATVTEKWGENPEHPWGGVEIGDPAYFRFVIDVEQEDHVQDGSLGWYDVTSAEISYGGIAVVPGNISFLEVDLLSIGGRHEVDIIAREVWTDNFFEAAVFTLAGFNVLPDDSIPIDFDLFDFTVERSIEYGDAESLYFRALFHSYEYRIIPAPGAALLLCVGGLFHSRRRRHG